MGLFSSNQSYLGVDIGSVGIKIVELKKTKGGLRLSTYGFSENTGGGLNASDWQKDIEYTAEVINKICEKAGVKSKNAIAALPTFSVFSSVINLASVAKKDIPSAINWEAKKVIPMPLEEMVLDWKEIENGQNKKGMSVLLTAAPKTLVKKYIEIFKAAKINLLSLETETFSLIRALLGNDKTPMMIVEIGASTTDISIVNKSIPLLNRSIDVGGATITNAISKNLNIGLERAEQFKYDLGISIGERKQEVIPQTIIEAISPIINEIKHMLNLFESKHNEKVEKIVLSGGSAILLNLPEYFSKIFNLNTIVGDPWSRVSCPIDLKPVLDEVAPRLAVAIGLAMRGQE
ncbi:MAG: type IV pilus assembly protein PilM [Patescibacteria group bacterium]|nr:type IV pilus assembly protein PilM [Patescibacteria group bacterium]MDD4610871.1 type IV pilus assembly protein PilM [Patescibacteria group bacterium]